LRWRRRETQARVLGFEDASQWTSTSADISLSSVHSEGAHSLQVEQLSGYSTLTSAPLSTLALSGKAISLDALVPSPAPSWLGNITGYLDAPSRNLYGVYLGYQQFASAALGVFQTLHFTIPGYAYTALTTGSYNDLTVRFGLALPEQSAPYLFDNLTFSTCGAAAPVAVSACREITTGGTYALQKDLSSSLDGSACLSIHDASNVELDCAGHRITGPPPLELHNVQGFSVHDCQVLSPRGFFLEVANSSNGKLSNNTLRVPGSTSESAIVDVSNSSALTFDNNTVFGSYQQNYSQKRVQEQSVRPRAPGPFVWQ
jgi:hypothetical protein